MGDISRSQPVGADDFLARFVPHEQMQIMLVELIEVRRFAGSLAGRAEGGLAQAADFGQDRWKLAGGSDIDGKLAGPRQQSLRSESGDFGCERLNGSGGRDSSGSACARRERQVGPRLS